MNTRSTLMNDFEQILKVFADTIEEDFENVSVEKALAPFDDWKPFSFTKHVSLQKRQRVSCQIGEKDGEPFPQIVHNEFPPPFNKWSVILFVNPKAGNLSPLWIPLREFLEVINKINGSHFIRVLKQLMKNEVPVENPSVVGVFLEQNFKQSSAGRFYDYESNLGKNFHFKFVFQKKSPNGDWVEIPDPRKKMANS